MIISFVLWCLWKSFADETQNFLQLWQTLTQGGLVSGVSNGTYSDDTSNRTRTYDPPLKVQVKCSAPLYCSSTWLLLLSPSFTSARSGRKWSTAAIYGQEMLSFHFPFLRVQGHLHVLVADKLFSIQQSLSHRVAFLLLCRYFHGKCSGELHSLANLQG